MVIYNARSQARQSRSRSARGLAATVVLVGLFASSCTSGDVEPDAPAKVTTTMVPPATTGAATTTETTLPPTTTTATTTELPIATTTVAAVPIAEPPDPRRGATIDFTDPTQRALALIAMAVDPADISRNLSTLQPMVPVPWDPGGAPGFQSDRLALEWGPDASNPGVIEAYKASYEADFTDAAPVEQLTIDIMITEDAAAAKDFEIAVFDQLAEDPTYTIDRSEGPAGEDYIFVGFGDIGLAAFAFVTIGDVFFGVTVLSEEPNQVEAVLEAAVAAVAERIRAVLDGQIGYGPFDDVSDHREAAMWTVIEGDPDAGDSIVYEGRFGNSQGTECSISFDGMPIFALAFDTEGRGHASFLDVEMGSSYGAWPQFGSCGRSNDGLPARFARVESRSVLTFLRDVPDLGTMIATRDEVAGRPAVRYDLTSAYQRYLDRYFADLTVDQFYLFLDEDEGWVAGYSVALSGDAGELEHHGFGGIGSSDRYAMDFRITSIDDAAPSSTLDGPMPAGAPGGGRVVFTSQRFGGARDIYVLDPGGEIRRLTTHPNGDELPALSPDGSTIAFVSRRTGNDSIFLIDVDGSNLRRLTAPVTDGGDSWPAWSPDGRSIVFGSDRDFLDDDLWIINVDGSGLRKLVGDEDGSEVWPAWSPDGNLIAFVSDRDASDARDLYTIRPDGTGLVRLTDDGFMYSRPSFSTDGSRILVTADEGPRFVMYLMDPDGSNREVLDTGGIQGVAGTFTPNGKFVIFSDGGDLWSISLSGTDLRRLTLHPEADDVPSTGVVYPSE